MASRLSSSVQVRTLARDLGLKVDGDPVREVLRYCERQVAGFLRKLPDTRTLSNLLGVVAASVETTFEIIRNDDDVERVAETYLGRGERIFANLKAELPDDVFGVTFRRTRRESWEPSFVSVIDCRGEKAAREFLLVSAEVVYGQ